MKVSEKQFWDVEETRGFIYVKGWDTLDYKVWNEGQPETLQRVADILADVRRDINTLLIYIHKNKEKWINHPIAFGIYHTFNLHTPNSDSKTFNSDNAINLINKNSGNELFNYQEMTPNLDGILGLNKPKELVNIPVVYKNKKIYYELATKRSIFLTIRPKLTPGGHSRFPDFINDYNKILDLAIHELTHTTCNDTRWKEDNHRHPYPEYHKMMREFATNCGIINNNKK